MMKVLLSAAFAVSIAMPVLAQAPEPVCNSQMTIETALIGEYGEEVIETYELPTEVGVIVWELWANPETMTWTLTGRMVGQGMCMFRAGTDYHGITIEGLMNLPAGAET